MSVNFPNSVFFTSSILSLTNPLFRSRSSGDVPFYKDSNSKQERIDDTGTKKPSQWQNFSLETLLLLWVDYIQKTMKWREKKLVLLRDLVGAPAVVTERGRGVERLQGGLRFTTNLIEPDSDTKAAAKRTSKRFSRLNSIVPEQWKFSYFLGRLTHKDDDKRVHLNCNKTFPAFNEFVNNCSDQLAKQYSKASKSPGSGAKAKKKSNDSDELYTPPGGKTNDQTARRAVTPRSVKGKGSKNDAVVLSDGTDEDEIVEDLEISGSEEEHAAVPAEKISIAAVTAQLRAIGTSQCTLPFDAQLKAIRWMAENSFMSVTVKPAFRAHFGSTKAPIALANFPAEISEFATAAFQYTVLAKETEQREKEALQTNSRQKVTIYNGPAILSQQEVQELERVKRLLDLRLMAKQIPRKSKSRDGGPGSEETETDDDETPEKRRKGTPTSPKPSEGAPVEPSTEKEHDSAGLDDTASGVSTPSLAAGGIHADMRQASEGTPPEPPNEKECDSAGLDDHQPDKRKRGSDDEEVTDDETGSTEHKDKARVKTRSSRGGDCSESVSAKKRRKDGDDDEEDGAGRDGSEDGRTRNGKESSSNSGGTRTDTKGKGDSTDGDQADTTGNKPTTNKAQMTPNMGGKYMGMAQTDESESESDDSDDDSVVTVITKFISSVPVVSPVNTHISDLFSFDEEDDGIKNVLDFEDGLHEDDTALTAVHIPDYFDFS